MIGNNIAPILIFVWLGFAVCIGLILSARLTKNVFQKRMEDALRPGDSEVDDLLIREQRDDEMSRSLGHRLLGPLLAKLGQRMKTTARGAKGEMVRDMLEQAGHPLGMGYSEFMALKTFMFMLMSVIGLLSSFVGVPFIIKFAELPNDAQTRLMFQAIYIMVFAFMGFSGPTFWLRKILNKRLKQIRKSMADVVDLIVLGIEAGLAFDSAVGKTVEKTKGPLTDELKRVLAEVNIGKSQGEAFRDMALRVKMRELSLLVAAIDQAMRMGVGLGHALKIQATEIREARMAFIREQAGKLPVKMMLPLVLFIFPALFVVILGPAACQMAEMGARGELSAFGG
ncbi:MAG TPA: type II secretion system F family protein [Abditibacteriaceae bacterium]|jgi:tight adherence protein C